MINSILSSIKTKVLGDADDESFDEELVDAINLAFAKLTQLGIGPREGFYIEDAQSDWNEYLSLVGNMTMAQAIKTYVTYQVRLIFDPPTSSFLLESLKKQSEELEWRLRSDSEFKEE